MPHFLTPEVPELNTTNRSVIDRTALKAFKDRQLILEHRPEPKPGEAFNPEIHRLPGMHQANLTAEEYATMHRRIIQAIAVKLRHDDRPETQLLHVAAHCYLSVGLNSDYGGNLNAALTQAIHDMNSMFVAGVQAAAKRLLGNLFDHANDLVEKEQTRIRAEVLTEVQADLEGRLAEQTEGHRLILSEQAEAHQVALNEQATMIRQLKQERAQLQTELSEARTQVNDLTGQLQQRASREDDQREVQVLRQRVIMLEREKQDGHARPDQASVQPAPAPLTLPTEQEVTADNLQQAFALKLWLDARGLTCTRLAATLRFCSMETGAVIFARFVAEVPDYRMYARQALSSKLRSA